MRNPRLKIGGRQYQFIGDLHKGRHFVNGVPLHMRGTMERMVHEKFLALLDADAEVTVLVGDTLDDVLVDPADTHTAATAILAAARKHTSRTFVLLSGNHDETKDLTKISSFDLLVLPLREAALPNLHVVKSGVVILDNVVYVGWSATRSAHDLVGSIPKARYDAVVGHWDTSLPPEANHYNMIPLKQLAEITDLVVTGHVHKPQDTLVEGVRLVGTGSILPLAHGEETKEDELFYTLTRAEYDEAPEKYARKFVRFLLTEDEELPDGDFLQIKVYTKPTKPETEEPEPETDTENFDLKKVLQSYLLKEGLDEDTAGEVAARLPSVEAD